MALEQAGFTPRLQVVESSLTSQQPNDPPLHSVGQTSIEGQEYLEVGEQDAMITAVQRTNRRIQKVPVDSTIVLQKQELKAWDDHYLANMATQKAKKAQNTSLAQARQNAAYWVVDQGLCDPKLRFAGNHDHPFSVFSGQVLLDLFCENSRDRGHKRSASTIEDGSDENGRRIRSSPPVGQDVNGQDTV